MVLVRNDWVNKTLRLGNTTVRRARTLRILLWSEVEGRIRTEGKGRNETYQSGTTWVNRGWRCADYWWGKELGEVRQRSG